MGIDAEQPKPDFLKQWSIDKIGLLEKYYKAYVRALNGKFELIYVDAFAGNPKQVSVKTGEAVLAAAARALNVTPSFNKYFLIDKNKRRAEAYLKSFGNRDGVFVFHDDSNRCLPIIFREHITNTSNSRSICLLDPYGCDLHWNVLCVAGKSGVSDVFINFPRMDLLRNVCRNDFRKITPVGFRRMNAFWGDETWRELMYERQGNQTVRVGDTGKLALAYCKRLREIAQFEYVLDPLPMKNSQGIPLYYLIFACEDKLANKIGGQIIRKFVDDRDGLSLDLQYP